MTRLLERIRKQLKNHAQWWTDYMTEMSILLISLAATFYGENLIESYHENQDDLQTMELVAGLPNGVQAPTTAGLWKQIHANL